MFKIYTKNNCGWCERAKRLLDENNIMYKVINIDESYDKFAFETIFLIKYNY